MISLAVKATAGVTLSYAQPQGDGVKPRPDQQQAPRHDGQVENNISSGQQDETDATQAVAGMDPEQVETVWRKEVYIE